MTKNNIMSLVKVRNKPSRSGNDLSKRISFTAKPGELHPIWWRNVLPGDHWEIDLNAFMRTAPVATASQGRLRYYYDFFFVPMEQLWQFFPEAITQMNDNKQHASGLLKSDNKSLDGNLPSYTIQDFNAYLAALEKAQDENMFGFKRSILSKRLFDYFSCNQFARNDVPSLIPNVPLSLFPWAAYQKIYADFFRYTQWETVNPATFNFNYMTGANDTELSDYRSKLVSSDFLKNSTIFDMRYCNYQKDLFHGLLPNSQFGEEAAVPLSIGGSGDLPYSFSGATVTGSTALPNAFLSSVDGAGLPSGTGSVRLSATSTVGDTVRQLTTINLDLSANSTLSILALRQYEMFQKWKEVAQAAEEDYKAQIEAHWGVSVSDYLSGMCSYLGGISGNVNVNEVVNQQLQDAEANIRGKGLDSANGKIRFNFNGQYGILMCIYHCLPILDYNTTMFHPEATLTKVVDYPIPELDSIGMEQLLSYNLSASTSVFSSPALLGYMPRYCLWKTDVDQCFGAFCSTLKNWILPFDDSDLVDTSNAPMSPDDNPNLAVSGSYLRYQFFKVNPHLVDDMFASEMQDGSSTDPLWNWCYLNIRVTRSLDRNGLPY